MVCRYGDDDPSHNLRSGCEYYLIRGLLKNSKEATELTLWYESGNLIFSPAPAWYEFLSGPVTMPQVNIIRAFLSGRIPTFEEP